MTVVETVAVWFFECESGHVVGVVNFFANTLSKGLDVSNHD